MILFPNKKYNIILADPPWKILGWDENPAKYNKSAGHHYEIQDIEWIKSLPVKTLSEDNCILFLWVTDPTLEVAFDVIKCWGFKYSTVGFTWVKTTENDKFHYGCGQWTRANPEMCLIAKKGTIEKKSCNVRQLQIAKVGDHSQKPIIIKHKIVELCGDLPRIELFGREQTDGWDVWGNAKYLQRTL